MFQLDLAVSNRYQRPSGLVLGFHGCDESVGKAVLTRKTRHLSPSKNLYDWLGDGIYFWENDPQRAFEFAEEAARDPKKSNGKIKKPFVIGAVIDLGLCLNFLERQALDELKMAHSFLVKTYQGKQLPENKGEDRGARFLDAAVISMLHKIRTALDSKATPVPSYDSVRGAFWEGGEIYPGAGFELKNHIQIAVRNPEHCIKGYFSPIY